MREERTEETESTEVDTHGDGVTEFSFQEKTS
jgi:hypothetical protein